MFYIHLNTCKIFQTTSIYSKLLFNLAIDKPLSLKEKYITPKKADPKYQITRKQNQQENTIP